jgi:hypothetical protein
MSFLSALHVLVGSLLNLAQLTLDSDLRFRLHPLAPRHTLLREPNFYAPLRGNAVEFPHRVTWLVCQKGKTDQSVNSF